MLAKVKEIVLRLEPEAEIYLFGSRARGDFMEDSDWDLLILLPGEVDWDRRIPIINDLTDLEVDEGIIFSRIISSKNEWYKDKVFKFTPFYQNVEPEKIEL